jgi:hypothetical protein
MRADMPGIALRLGKYGRVRNTAAAMAILAAVRRGSIVRIANK